jgi:ferredoxin
MTDKKKDNEDKKAKITVDDDLCIGCGSCISTAPECFEFNDQGKSVVKEDCKATENVKKAADECPVAAIEIK